MPNKRLAFVNALCQGKKIADRKPRAWPAKKTTHNIFYVNHLGMPFYKPYEAPACAVFWRSGFTKWHRLPGLHKTGYVPFFLPLSPV